MIADITEDGFVLVKAETIVEAFALQKVMPVSNLCEKCGQPKNSIILDCSVLMQKGN